MDPLKSDDRDLADNFLSRITSALVKETVSLHGLCNERSTSEGEGLPASNQVMESITSFFNVEPEGSPYSLDAFLAMLSNTRRLTIKNEPLENNPYPESRVSKYSLCDSDVIGTHSVFRSDTDMLGVAPNGTKIEDEVWILAGTIKPVVLRSKGGPNYEFLGAAYVHGVMWGEALPENPEWSVVVLE